jgi:hypothetical protein
MKELLLFVVGAITIGILVPAGVMVWLSVIDELKERRK